MTEPQAPTTSATAPPPPGAFGTKIPSSVTFAVALILFFMPFVTITCNSMTLQNISGVQLATGFRIDPGGTKNSFLGQSLDNENNNVKYKKEEPNSYALVALGLGLLGFILSLQNMRVGGTGGMLTGILSAVALVGLMVDIRSTIHTKIPESDANVQVSVEITPWFYISIICFLAAAFFSYKRLQAKAK